MYKIKFTEAAVQEIESASRWYSAQQDNLDERFKKSISSALEKLHSDKMIHGAAYRGLSRVFVKEFPVQHIFQERQST